MKSTVPETNAAVREVCATTIGLAPLPAESPGGAVDPMITEFAEQFSADVSGITAAQRAAYTDLGRFVSPRLGQEIIINDTLRLSPDDLRRRALITQLMCNFWVDLRAVGAVGSEADVALTLVPEGHVSLNVCRKPRRAPSLPKGIS